MDIFVLMNKFKNSQTTLLGDVALNYHHTRFGDNCKTQCGNISQTVKKLLTGGKKLAPSLRMDLDGELIVERNYGKSDICIKNKHT